MAMVVQVLSNINFVGVVTITQLQGYVTNLACIKTYTGICRHTRTCHAPAEPNIQENQYSFQVDRPSGGAATYLLAMH